MQRPWKLRKIVYLDTSSELYHECSTFCKITLSIATLFTMFESHFYIPNRHCNSYVHSNPPNRCKHLISLLFFYYSQWPVIFILKTHHYLWLITSFIYHIYHRILYTRFKVICIGGLFYIWILFQDNKDNIEAQPYQGEFQNTNNTSKESIRIGNHLHRPTSINHS